MRDLGTGQLCRSTRDDEVIVADYKLVHWDLFQVRRSTRDDEVIVADPGAPVRLHDPPAAAPAMTK